MSAVEDRIVEMKFDNKQFEPAARTTMSTLDRLKAALNFSGSNKSLNDLQSTASRFSLGGLANAAQGVSGKFLAMSAVAIAAIANITNRAVDAGIKIFKAFTLDPIKQGFQEYETQLNAVQTILANTQSSGATLKDVNNALNTLNTYADKTIYNFSEMARNIGTFTAAGVDLDKSVSAIKGIANLAALSGSNSQQASTAMYQLSQAISAGRVGLQDWNSVVNAGMGGAVFQRALAMNAEKMGTLNKGAVKFHGAMKNVTVDGKSFRESITAKPGEKSWLTSDVLTRTLSQFTGDLSDAQLAAQGFNKEEIKAIQQTAKTAQQAATQVKTFTALMDTLKEAAGSGWAQTFSIVLGDFEESRRLWTDISNVVGGALQNSAKARNKMLQDWKDLGGRKALLEGFKNIFDAIVKVVTPIRQAFREIFPPTTGKQLFAMTQNFLNFTKNLKIGATTLNNLKRTFAGFFAIFSIGWSIVKAVLRVIGDLFGVLSSNSGSFLAITANIGDFLVNLDKTIKKGDLINKFFDKLGAILQVPLGLLKAVGLVIKGIFTGFDKGTGQAIADVFKRIGDRLAPLSGVGKAVAAIWARLSAIFKGVMRFLAPAISAIGQALSGVGDAIAKAFKEGDFSSVFDALNTGLLAGIVLLIHNFLKKGFKIDFGGGFVESIKTTFETLTSTLTALQTQVKARTLLLIAGALALLTASIVALSLIDSDKLSKAMGAISIAFGQLLAAMAILSSISKSAGFVKIPVIAASMILLSGAILILSGAVAVLANLNWNELAKGLLGVGTLLLMLVLASKGIEKSSGGLVRAGLAMIPFAIGLKILASAVKDFGQMQWGEIAKGLVAMAGALVVITAAINFMPKSMILQAAGLVILGFALQEISKALSDMSGMTWGEIAKGLVVLAGSMVIMAAALDVMSGGLPGAAALIIAAAALRVFTPAIQAMGEMKWVEIGKAMTVLFGSLLLLAAGMVAMEAGLPGAAAMLVAAAALVVLTPALQGMADLSWEEIGKAMVVLAGSMLVLSAGLNAMILALPGAAALTIATAALAVLTPVLLVLGNMSWEQIAKGLIAIAGAFVIIGLTSAILLPLIPAILGLSAAMLLLGASMALIGAGCIAVATAFSIFAAAGTAGIAVLTGMISLIPYFMKKFAEGILSFATTIASHAAEFTRAFASLLNSLLDALIQVIPKVGHLFTVLIQTGLSILNRNVPAIANSGMRLILALLSAMSKNVGKIVNVVSDLIVKFLGALSRNTGRVLQAGANFIINFINRLAGTIRANQGRMNQAGYNLASAIIGGMASGLWYGVGRVISAAVSVASRALAAAKSVLGIHSPSKEFFKVGDWSTQGMALGFSQNGSLVEDAATGVAKSSLDAMREAMRNMSDLFPDDLTANPVITPVLDLSKLTQDASQIGGVLGQNAISANLSFGQAMDISNTEQAKRDNGIVGGSGGNTYIDYKQYNTSPEPLPAGEIYRNTKSSLSRLKEGLDKK